MPADPVSLFFESHSIRLPFSHRRLFFLIGFKGQSVGHNCAPYQVPKFEKKLSHFNCSYWNSVPNLSIFEVRHRQETRCKEGQTDFRGVSSNMDLFGDYAETVL